MLTATDIYDALHYGRGIRNTKVSVIESNFEESKIVGTEIKNISSYQSIVFHPDSMKMYRYFDVGIGVSVPYSSDHKFTPCYEIVREFHHTQKDQAVRIQPPQKKKKRADHTSCSMIFCENTMCTDVFETQEEYEFHLLSERHTIHEKRSSMDCVKAKRMSKTSSYCLIFTQP